MIIKHVKKLQIDIESKNGGDLQPSLAPQAKTDPMGTKNKTESLAGVSQIGTTNLTAHCQNLHDTDNDNHVYLIIMLTKTVASIVLSFMLHLTMSLMKQ